MQRSRVLRSVLARLRRSRLFRGWSGGRERGPGEAMAVRSRGALPLSFERLEDRTLMAVLTVNSLLDNNTPMDGLVTLGEAIDAANFGLTTDLGQTGVMGGLDEIVFAGSLAGTITLTAGEFFVDDDLVITGLRTNFTNLITINGNLSSRMFQVLGANVDLTLEKLNLTGGRAIGAGEDGGAIRSIATGDTTLTLKSCVLNENRASYLGGAVYAQEGQIVVSNSYLDSNLGIDAFAKGGAIYAKTADVSVHEGQLRGNQSGQGGAISTFSGNITITDSALSINRALEGNGGAIASFSGAVNMDDCVLAQNVTVAPASEGGAISVLAGNISILRSQISGNKTQGSDSDGGAIYAITGKITIADSELSGNTALGANSDGGAIASTGTGDILISNSTLSGNSASRLGGGMFASQGDVTIVNSTITLNSAELSAGVGTSSASPGATLKIFNSIIAANTAIDGTDDFIAPFNANTALEVRSSLIGRSTGTTLTATSGSTPSANGNFVGGGSFATRLDPGLQALNANGGSTFTHALLPGSLAINRGDNTRATLDGSVGGVALLRDQRGAGFSRISTGRVDMGAFEAQGYAASGNVAFFAGTDAAEAFIFNLATRQVTVNGLTYFLPAGLTNIQFEGRGGVDSFALLGTVGRDEVNLQPFSATLFNSVSGYTSFANGMEGIAFFGQGGADTAVLGDSAGNDKFVGRDELSFMQGLTLPYFNSVHGQVQVEASAVSGGNDIAYLFDTAGNDTLNLTESFASMQTTGVLASFFEIFVGSASTGNDFARLTGTAAADVLLASQAFVQLAGNGKTLAVVGFGSVSADGAGGSDIARLYGRAGVDTLTSDPSRGFNFVSLSGTGYSFGVQGFESVIAAAIGAGDVATLRDSAGDDAFVANGAIGTLSRDGRNVSAVGFSRITIVAFGAGTNRILRRATPTFTLVQAGAWVG